MRRDIDQRRATLGNKRGREFNSASVGEVKRAALGIEHPGRALDDQSMQIRRPDGFAKGFTEAVEKIEDEGLFDLHLFVGPFQAPNAATLPEKSKNPNREAGDKQPEQKGWR